jgi:hypothetical protein
MGSGIYCYSAAVDRSETRALYASSVSDTVFRETTFKQRSLDPEMNIYGKIRESRDSEEHPNSFPIIIALDTTGSMGQIPQTLITGAFPEIMKNIIDAGIPDPQVCFIGVGDTYYDSAPIQCGQFESSDELMEKWLQKVYLEGGGGGNTGESYNLAWYFATYHTVTDAWEKRQQKGIIITIGDEPCLQEIPKGDIEQLFGDDVQSGKTSSKLLSEAKERWDIFHIHMGTSSWYNSTINKWSQLLDNNDENETLFIVPRDNSNIVSVISSIILNTYNKNKKVFNLPKDHINKETSNDIIEQKISL